MQNITDIAPAILRWATAMIRQFPIFSIIIALMLMIQIGMLIYMNAHLIKVIPVAISRIQQHHFSNYVGFPIDKPGLDAQSISYGEVTITNISNDRKVAIDFTLHITGQDGTDIKSRADLLGPSGMILGKDDKTARHSANLPFGEALKYFRNPVELAAGHTERGQLEFLFKFGSESRDEFAMRMFHDDDYKFDLEIRDLISGNIITLHLPAEYRGDQ